MPANPDLDRDQHARHPYPSVPAPPQGAFVQVVLAILQALSDDHKMVPLRIFPTLLMLIDKPSREGGHDPTLLSAQDYTT